VIPTSSVEYVHLPAGSALPALQNTPRRMVVLIEQDVEADWQAEVSDWIVNSGCLYMMAWGRECSRWDDSVDMAMLEQFDFGDIPDEREVWTTWHENDTLEDVFFFCLSCAEHQNIALPTVTILHIAESDRRAEILDVFAKERAKLAAG